MFDRVRDGFAWPLPGPRIGRCWRRFRWHNNVAGSNRFWLVPLSTFGVWRTSHTSLWMGCELSILISRDLRRLPTPVAPPNFVARVMAARQALDARPWHARAWVTWPLEWRVASGAALASVVVLMALATPFVYSMVSEFALRGVTEYAPSLRAGFVMVDAIWQSIVRPVAVLLLPVVLLMWAACAVCGVALTRIASGEVSGS